MVIQQFSLTNTPLEPAQLWQPLASLRAGAFVSFEGWVRNHNHGKIVTALEYEVYPALALKEGDQVLAEAIEKFDLLGAIACHRYGRLTLGEIAVWVGVTAPHRKQAFAGAAYIIDEIKHRLPIWKKEYYLDEPAVWVSCRNHCHSSAL
ncbi:molybdenum converting factor subunit 2 MoaE [Thermosynechococcus sp. NK55a]|jgi:molybdopterin synthase catalytic subunit|uniref:molybdenum cofactor biosynthesis protein MoaE n=1 Tax=unclassified Thermosynechococcus TaxID=2622553 RepID=UPI0003D8DC39|nr:MULTISPECIES: molybdenum cofactor biosynthesis protein MoaE [unclassified Thermosynechococcus]AHB87813.1 molybdenum converting factor subunit 2 MoaE [Thermosynechococcus sp. NK55a]RMH64029.1 MAG: molybdenum cofactor biosynthesis protein MoaE [Cyanobacteria bacterium J003]HIK23896.1 molybdenum cofactor biosynthesis protein MoaE [Thermosynechococcus sp. M3746_W2019_013]